MGVTLESLTGLRIAWKYLQLQPDEVGHVVLVHLPRLFRLLRFSGLGSLQKLPIRISLGFTMQELRNKSKVILCFCGCHSWAARTRACPVLLRRIMSGYDIPSIDFAAL